MATLKNGMQIPLWGLRQPAKIVDYINEGGQGEVYRVLFNGGEYALKWYSKDVPTDAFYDNLAHNIRLGAPAQYFLWPLAITEKLNGRFGYIMELRPPNYWEYGDFLMDRVRFSSWDTMFVTALNIVEGFLRLHSIGYSYQDVNEGSFFIDPSNGDVLICDNDNVAPFGVNLGVRGVPRYMAPEVVLNRAYPNTHTDRFSLALILFRLFYIDHPLEGRYAVKFPLTDKNGAYVFGVHPVFIYDPKDKSNRPTPDAQPNVIERWPMFPPDMNAAFTKAFTAGMKDVNSRVTELQWREVLIKARGMLVRLDGKEQFVNAYQPQSLPVGCRLLHTEDLIIALAPDTRLYACQIDRMGTDYKKPMALVKTGGAGGKLYVLTNLSDSVWTVSIPGQSPVKVSPNNSAPLVPGVVIDFGSVKGKVF